MYPHTFFASWGPGVCWGQNNYKGCAQHLFWIHGTRAIHCCARPRVEYLWHPRGVSICNKGIQLSVPINSYLAVTLKDEYFVWSDNGIITVQNRITGNKVEISGSNSNKLMSRDGRVYVQENDTVCEIIIKETVNNKFMCFINVVANILPQATQMFSGIILQNMLGTWFASVPFASGSCVQVSLKELNGYRIIDAKSEKNVLMVIGFISNFIAQASVAYGRICEVLNAPETRDTGTIESPLKGKIGRQQ